MKKSGLPILCCKLVILGLTLIAVCKGNAVFNCSAVCGYGASCKSFQCGNEPCSLCACDDGINNTATLPDSMPPVIYCFKKCSKKGECPENTTCDLEHNKNRCECGEGFVRSDLGACVEEECNGECGHGTRCDRGNCHCLYNYAGKKKLTHSKGSVYYCTHICNEDGTVCPPNTTCTGVNIYNTTKYRCQCSPGFNVSYPGQCLATSSQIPATHSPTQTAAFNLEACIGGGIGGGVLLIIIIAVIILLFRKRHKKNSTKNISVIDRATTNGKLDDTITTTPTKDFDRGYEIIGEFSANQTLSGNSTLPLDERQPVESHGGGSGYAEVGLPVESDLMVDGSDPYSVPKMPKSTGREGAITVSGLYSNDKIPETKAMQQAQKQSSPDDSTPSNYNTLYSTAEESANGKEDNVVPVVTGSRKADVIYDTTVEITDSEGAGFGPTRDQQPNEAQYDRLKMSHV